MARPDLLESGTARAWVKRSPVRLGGSESAGMLARLLRAVSVPPAAA